MVLVLSDWRCILSRKAAEACPEGGRNAAAGVSDALPTFNCDVKCQTTFKFYFQSLQGAHQFFKSVPSPDVLTNDASCHYSLKNKGDLLASVVPEPLTSMNLSIQQIVEKSSSDY